MIHRAADRVAEVAGVDRLEARVVRKDTRDHAAGAPCGGHTAEDQDHLPDPVEHIVFKEHQIAVNDDGDEDQQHPHRDHRSEHAEALHHKGRGPLLELAPVVERHHADDRRRDQIQEDHVEDARHAVEHDDREIPNQLERHDVHHNVVEAAHAKVGGHLLVAVNILLAHIVGPAQRILHRDVLVVDRIFCRPHGTHQKHQPVERNARAAAGILARIGAQR